ncbi:acetylornithine deacetylase [Palleronia aestuarii]|uniref:acetylornithine deacetylase n=1 Tax=Palleronia aestuarii TaxID=568105 RepID=UPI001F2DB0E9|nr:acetylornithine deacetylase [Palleronia aestuarii]
MTEALDRTIAHLDELIAQPTISSASNRATIDTMADRLDALGARCRILEDPTGEKANLFATFGPETDGGIVLSGHADVVPAEEPGWSSDPFVMRDDGERLYGRGTCDMKGFLAAILATAPLYARGTLRRPLHVCVTYDEEVGCLGARQLTAAMTDWPFRPAFALIGEPTSMRVVEGHKGCCEYTTRFRGLEGHGSQPDKGVSAIEFATMFVTRLLSLRGELALRAPDGSRFDPPGTTLQVGRIAGGVAHNVIAGDAQVDWELRPVARADFDHVIRTMRDYCNDVLLPAMRAVHPGSTIATEVIGEVAGLAPVTENEARDVACALTGANGAEVVAFGTEAGLFQQIGMAAAICGPGDIAQAHKADEFVSKAQLSSCLNLLEGLDVYLRA